jgi:photosystem II stability/assembly factor-like uncharacterized protein
MKKLLIILSFVSLTIIANGQWQLTSLDSLTVFSLAAKGDTIFAGTEYGVYMSTNNGDNWKVVDSGLINIFILSFAISGNNIFVATNGDGVFLSSNNGQLWTAVNNGLTPNIIEALIISKDTIYAGGNCGGVYLSSNNGNSWKAVDSGLMDTTVTNCIFSLAKSDSNIFAGTPDGVYYSSNNGMFWKAVNNTLPINYYGDYPFVNALAIKRDTVFAGADQGLFSSSNNGSSWIGVNSGSSNSWVFSLITSGNSIFAGTASGVCFSSNNGSKWTAINNGLPTNTSVEALAINENYLFAGTGNDYGGIGVWRLPISALGIKEINDNAGNIAVYPNPVINNVTIESMQKSTIEIIDIQGQTIMQQTVPQGKSDIDISGLVKGVYILRLCSNDKTEVTRIVKE